MKINKQLELAQYGENFVLKILTDKNWTILKKNYRGIGFEIDIIARKNDTLKFIEVKTRTKINSELASYEALLSKNKIFALKRGINSFLNKFEPEFYTISIDLYVISIQPSFKLQHFENIIDNY